MSALNGSTLYRQADRSITLTFTRPTGVNWDFLTSDILIVFKLDYSQVNSVFEASSATSVTRYLDLSGNLAETGNIPVVRATDSIRGELIFPRTQLLRNFAFRTRREIVYTAWLLININGQVYHRVQENGSIVVEPTASKD